MATTATGDSFPAVALEGVGRAYGERVALREVSFTLPAGATVAVFGANGAGKTTLLRILAGLLRPHAGRAAVLGAELPREAHRARGRIGLVGHEPMLYRDLTVRENLRFHARLHGVDERRPDALCAQVGLAARADDPVRTLSRGMTQRAAICRAVLHAPELLLLDEPLANLDPGGAEAVEPLLRGPARVLISHDAQDGLAAADWVLGLRGGPGHAPVHRLGLRALPLRARPRVAGGRPRGGRAVGHAPARRRAGDEPAVRRRARAGRLRRLPHGARRPDGDVRRQGAAALRLPARGRARGGAGLRDP